MITADKIRMYQRYEGNVDNFARSGSAAQQAAFPTKEWSLIAELLENLRLERDGLAADAFRQQLQQQVVAACDTSETATLLKQLALQQEPAPSRARAWWVIAAILALALLLWWLLLAR